MARRPLQIGLSARLMHEPPRELGFPGKTLQYLEQSMAHWVMAHGALVFMIPTIGRRAEVARQAISVRDCVAALDGLVLQGGADVCPSSYGEEAERPEWSGDRLRDLYEIELIWEFIVQGKPVLGICRGCQLINVAMGGSLWQDIPTHIEGAIAHRDDALYDRYHHEVEIVAGSQLAALYPEGSRFLVNSIHHQCVRRLGSDLVVEAYSAADGVIEAIRRKGSGYVAGFQWHPEFHGSVFGLLDSRPMLVEFLEAAERRVLGG
ncbi:MAG: peptidase C26 [Candidatus Accumulibacter sp. 66-26]|nr:gamma-glutamyl-gamma-aminobutyrate hydrolase family protein [Accumulibacter sp.]OJW48940.1 MAG: peptidase C26 [Candidatus Accumulibacter sp. 66-26]